MDIRKTREFLEFGFNVVICPVCGKETLDNHFICPHCGWEYDGIEDLNIPSSVNRCETINQYRTHMQL